MENNFLNIDIYINMYKHITLLYTWNRVIQLCPTLFNPMDCSPPGSSVRGILQARILEWDAMPVSRIFPLQGLNTHLTAPALAGRFFTTSATWDQL